MSGTANLVCVSLSLQIEVEEPPRLPSFAIFDNKNVIAEDDDDDDIDVARELLEDWDVWGDGADL